MSLLKVNIHFVWGTKNRVQFLDTKELRQNVWNHIKVNANEKGIFIDNVNGYSDHCHCLVTLRADQSIQKVIQLIKGESSFWINKQKLTSHKFEWQEDYFALSVSESMLGIVRNYINNQEEHHSKKSFQQEYNELIKNFGLD